MITVDETFLGEDAIPVVWRVTRGEDANIDTVEAWLREHKPLLTEACDRYGAVLLRGFRAIDSVERFAIVLNVVAPELMDYIGGSAPRRPVLGRISTTSDLPENYSLALHQEMAYQAHRPDALAFFCDVPPDVQGETTVADARVVTSQIDVAVRARFDAKGVCVRRALPPVQAENRLPKPWPHVLGTTDRDEANRLASDKGWKVEWRSDDWIYLWQQVLPAFKTHPRTGERVWANQVHYHTPECMLRWALRDSRDGDAAEIRNAMAETPDKLDYVFHGDDTRVSGEDAEHVWDVLVRSEIPVRWQRGDVMLVDNVLAMHGRRPFRGRRRVLVGLIKEKD